MLLFCGHWEKLEAEKVLGTPRPDHPVGTQQVRSSREGHTASAPPGHQADTGSVALSSEP